MVMVKNDFVGVLLAVSLMCNGCLQDNNFGLAFLHFIPAPFLFVL